VVADEEGAFLRVKGWGYVGLVDGFLSSWEVVGKVEERGEVGLPGWRRG